MSDDRAHVLDILLAGRTIVQFVTDVAQQSFLESLEKQSAVLYQFTILGEAARRVSLAFRALHPEVDWTGILGFRNRIVHEYDDVDLDKVWQIVQTDLPKMIAMLEPLAPEPPDGEQL